MENIVVFIINYIYMLGALAFVSEYLISRDKGDILTLKLIDLKDFLSFKKIDKLISRVSLFLLEKYDHFYGKKYFGIREWTTSSIIAFTYCYAFYLIEKSIGYQSTLAKQLSYWFIPNLIADIASINFTRWLLKKIYKNPNKYFKYLLYDILAFLCFFYICFSFTMIYLYLYSNYDIIRVIFHPIYLFSTAFKNYPQPISIDSILIISIASTTLIPTIIHVLLIIFALSSKAIIPAINFFTDNLIEKMISFDRHPIGVAVITTGIFVLPFVLLIKVFF